MSRARAAAVSRAGVPSREEVAAASRAQVEALFAEMIAAQRAKLVALARRIDPSLSADDLLQPHDHLGLAASAPYQFEDGLLAGLLSARAALLAKIRE